ncbi:neutral/alkaline non-lysosomal ceramidase N-terminal domain-containing protein [Plebeiibacterium sediminum]|uniref:Neutral/alkaline non-lysosomal ceramidase N-terminal domain-containing protein n=1 Tax=Plebeiibacterium sediminum TaxID=2992112 RepID=A0AAE3M548_9BACT|nr:neutral/alkaline non-lysosomal ceramidase N-terminal domain-containing protein [Plebeiobacterium sediminum]MCW3787319.1 hypothetical protein [Plebeiobacterium sediminum]
MTNKKIFLTLLVGIISLLALPINAQSIQQIKVGAAKVDITPDENALPKGYDSIRDGLFCRAIVIDNGVTEAALVAVDQGMVNNDLYNNITKKIEEETGIPALNVFISPSHTHSAPWGAEASVEKGVIDVVKAAKSNIQPATISYKTGLAYLNINRDVIDPETRLWKQGPNHAGPSDKTVAVLTFRDASGTPIAVYYNYAMHANMMFMSGTISADFPGEASKYIEDYLGNDVVALFSSGAAGDQNPITTQPMEQVGHKKVEALIESGKAKDLAEAIMMAGFLGNGEVQVDQAALDRQSQMISSLGQILGEEVIRVTGLPQRTDSVIAIQGSKEIITCPGRKRTNTGREGAPGTYVDGDPVNIKLSLLRLGDVAIAGVNAEVYNIIAQRFKEESPLTNVIFSSITNGSSNSGYIPDDAAFQRYTFQVLSSRLKPNHAERGIIDGLVHLIEESEQ